MTCRPEKAGQSAGGRIGARPCGTCSGPGPAHRTEPARSRGGAMLTASADARRTPSGACGLWRDGRPAPGDHWRIPSANGNRAYCGACVARADTCVSLRYEAAPFLERAAKLRRFAEPTKPFGKLASRKALIQAVTAVKRPSSVVRTLDLCRACRTIISATPPR